MSLKSLCSLAFVGLVSCGDEVANIKSGGIDVSSMSLSFGIEADNPVFVGGQNGYKVYRAPTMVTTQKNTILAFSEGRVNGHADEDDMDVVLRRSEDGGKTWQKL